MLNRRQLIKLTASAFGLALAAPQVLWAFARKGFSAQGIDNSVKTVFNSTNLTDSNKVVLTVPAIAENGAVVPVTVKTTLKNVEAIAIFVEKNPAPLAASFAVNSNMKPEVSTRIKMRGSSMVRAVIKSEGKLYSTAKEVKVTLGGCGG